VLEVGSGLTVQTGNGAVRVRSVQLDGEDECDAAQWAGAHAVVAGERLS
jgi:hypothetical protein